MTTTTEQSPLQRFLERNPLQRAMVREIDAIAIHLNRAVTACDLNDPDGTRLSLRTARELLARLEAAAEGQRDERAWGVWTRCASCHLPMGAGHFADATLWRYADGRKGADGSWDGSPVRCDCCTEWAWAEGPERAATAREEADYR